MTFTDFFLKILPLYVLILTGFLVGRKSKLQAADLAVINLHFIAPMIFFHSIARVGFAAENLILPLTCMALLGSLAAGVFFVTKLVSPDAQKPFWLSGAFSTTNTGYFGIPVFLILFGAENLGVYMLYAVGSTIFFYTVTTYLFIRSHYTVRQAFGKIIRLPVIHAMLLGILCQLLDLRPPVIFDDFFVMLRGAYVVIGMMIIGLVLGGQSETRAGFVFEWKLLAAAQVVRFVIFPLLAVATVLLDRYTLHVFSPLAEKIILLVSLMPMGADTTSLAAQWQMHPERIAALVLVNSTVALFIIPLAAPLLLQI